MPHCSGPARHPLCVPFRAGPPAYLGPWGLEASSWAVDLTHPSRQAVPSTPQPPPGARRLGTQRPSPTKGATRNPAPPGAVHAVQRELDSGGGLPRPLDRAASVLREAREVGVLGGGFLSGCAVVSAVRRGGGVASWAVGCAARPRRGAAVSESPVPDKCQKWKHAGSDDSGRRGATSLRKPFAGRCLSSIFLPRLVSPFSP